MVEITDVSFAYTGETVLKDVRLTVEEGDFLVLFGADDAGKTTLAHLLTGLLKRQEGSITLFGQDIDQFTEQERAWLRYVPDEVVLENITAADYFSLWQSVSLEYDRELEDKLCEMFQVNQQNKFLNMTYGENKSAQMIAAICARPRLLILDEPANFLTDKLWLDFLQVLKECHVEGMTILLITEKYADAAGYANRYAYLKEGTIKNSADVPVPERRWKVITMEGGNSEILNKMMNGHEVRGDQNICLYREDMTKLPLILQRTGGRDFIVEETTLEEELDMDFSRWEM